MTGELTGRKDDADKLRYDLVPPFPLSELARVYTIGAAKYGDDNYLGGMAWQRVLAAMMRHLEAFRAGESIDQKGGQLHLASVAWCCFTLMLYEKEGLGVDDRRPGLPINQDNMQAARAYLADDDKPDPKLLDAVTVTHILVEDIKHELRRLGIQRKIHQRSLADDLWVGSRPVRGPASYFMVTLGSSPLGIIKPTEMQTYKTRQLWVRRAAQTVRNIWAEEEGGHQCHAH